MTPPIAFDPGAEYVDATASARLVEAVAYQHTDGRIEIRLMEDAEDIVGAVTLSADFFDALAQARAREQAA